MLKNSMFWEVNKHILMVLVIICHDKRFKLHHKTIFWTDYYIFFLPHSRKCLRWRKPIIPVYNRSGGGCYHTPAVMLIRSKNIELDRHI